MTDETPTPENQEPTAEVPQNDGDNGEEKKHSPGAGLTFFIALIAVLAGLMLFYLQLHRVHPAAGKPLSVELLQAAVDARYAVEQNDSEALEKVVKTTRQRLEPVLEKRQRFAEADALASSLRALEKLAPDLDEPEPEPAASGKTGAAAQAEAEVEAAEGEPAETTEAETTEAGGESTEEEAGTAAASSRDQALAEIHAWASLIVDGAGTTESADPVVTTGDFFWRDSPYRYLEILFWALFGILVHLLVTVGVYLKKHRFWARGIYQHVALFLSVPFLTFVFVTLVSLVKLEVGFSAEQGTLLDLRDPRILAAISFLVASRPWGLWDYLKDAAGRLFGREKPEKREKPDGK